MISDYPRSSVKAKFWAALALILTGWTVERQASAQQSSGSAVPIFYSHGNPTSEEQYLLQKLNRARMDPVGEGQRLADWLRNTSDGQHIVAQFGTNPDQVAADVAAFPAVAPLAFNSELLAAARSHCADLAPHNGVGPGGDSNPLLDHNGYDGSTPESRVAAAGYTGYPGVVGGGGYAGENYSGGSSGLDAIHAGYLVDWGNPDFGHRKNIYLGGDVRKVGVGLATKPNSLNSPNPLVSTEDFGQDGYVFVRSTGHLTWADSPAILTGVVYRDANGNGQYDVGEGVPNAQVAMDGGAYYTVTSGSGGYALPLVKADGSNALGDVTVRMTGLPDSTSYSSVLSVKALPTSFGPVNANVEWNGLVDQDSSAGPGDNTASIAGGGTVHAGSKLTLTVTRLSGSDTSRPLTITYKTKGSAVAGLDYKTLPGTITIPVGTTSAKIKVKAMAGSGVQTVLTLKSKAGAIGKVSVIIIP